jgi:GDP-L-fucose synthase
MAKASVFVMELAKEQYDQVTEPMQSHLNVGFGSDVTIAQLAQAVAKVVGYPGTIALDPTKPDGSPKKLMNSKRLNTLGWKAAVSLDDGLALAYAQFVNDHAK